MHASTATCTGPQNQNNLLKKKKEINLQNSHLHASVNSHDCYRTQ